MARADAWNPSLEGRRILVTGAGGFIGSRLAERLSRSGATVGAISRTEASAWPSEGAVDFVPITCDIRDAHTVTRVVSDFNPEIVYHFAAHPDGPESHPQADTSIRVNVLGTLNLLDAFASNQGRLFVFGDSTKVYGNAALPYRESLPAAPTSSYAIAKGAAWELCQLYERLHGIAVTSLRPTMIYGPGQGRNIIRFVIETILEGKRQIPLMGGTQTRDPLFVDDALDAFVTAAQIGPRLSGRVVPVGGGREISIRDLAQRVIQIMGSDAELVVQPQNVRPTEIWRSFCDNEEAKQLLGWTPVVSLDEGVEKTVEAMTSAATLPTLSDEPSPFFAQP